MERSEPELVPEWLRSTGNVSGGGNSAHHSASSSSLSDVSSSVHRGRSRISRNISDFDSPSFAFLNRASSLNSRRSSNNGSSRHAYSSFSRSHRDKDREWDKERLSFGVRWDSDSSDPLESILTSSVEKLGGISTSKVETDTFRQSHSMVSRKQAETFPQRTAVDSRDSGNSNNNNGNGLVSGGAIGSSIQKAAFRKDFPSLGTEERQSVPEIARVTSPGLSSVSQCLSVGNSALIDGEGWTSALAESPTVVGSSSSTGSLPVPLTVSTPVSGVPSSTSALNMAVALAQAPSRARTASQLSVNTQRRKELAIKQSRQLIPVTHSMPKGSVLNSVDKSKAKPASRTSDVNMAVKSGQQQLSFIHNGNQSPHSGHFKSDMPKTSGKLLVLKPGWENGGSSPTKKDIAIPTTIANSRVITSQRAIAPVPSAAARNSNISKLSVGEPKVAPLDPISGFNAEKRPSLAQTQSRNDFFNLLKKKTPSNSSASLSDSDPHISCSTTKESEVTKEIVGASVTAHANKKGTASTSNGDVCQEPQRFSNDDEKDFSSTAMVHSEEEEIAFLRSLGWEENSTEDGGLTEEEINDFYQEFLQHMKLRPSMELCNGILSKLAESLATKLNEVSSESISPDS